VKSIHAAPHPEKGHARAVLTTARRLVSPGACQKGIYDLIDAT